MGKLSAGWEWGMVEDEDGEVEDKLDVGVGGIRMRRVWEVELGCEGSRMESGEAGSGLGRLLLGYVSSLEAGQYNRTTKRSLSSGMHT